MVETQKNDFVVKGLAACHVETQHLAQITATPRNRPFLDCWPDWLYITSTHGNGSLLQNIALC